MEEDETHEEPTGDEDSRLALNNHFDKSQQESQFQLDENGMPIVDNELS